MNKETPFDRLFQKRDRLMVGVMSGTSVDAVDVAIARISGSGTGIEIETLGSHTEPIDSDLRGAIEANMAVETSNVRDLALLNVRLAHLYADAARAVVETSGLLLRNVDAIGSHGQTMYHQPDPVAVAGLDVSATLQLGDPSVLANLIGIPVVGDFRMADMALGGQGAPLVPYFDYVCFRSETEGRVLLNLGGIANMTAMPAGCELTDVLAFDTGPANRVLDALSIRFLDSPFDANGKIARKGRCSELLLTELLSDPWFAKKPPKSTGRELFSVQYVQDLILRANELDLATEDLFATAALLTARSVGEAWRSNLEPGIRVDRLIVSGGGVHNQAVMEGLQKEFGRIPVETTDLYGVDPDAKEAICFALLAHETLNGVSTNVPSATGARAPAILGKICMPASAASP